VFCYTFALGGQPVSTNQLGIEDIASAIVRAILSPRQSPLLGFYDFRGKQIAQRKQEGLILILLDEWSSLACRLSLDLDP